MNKRTAGQHGEDIAANYIKKKGYRIMQRNFRCRYGEIDIVAEHKGCLVFIEVRSKTTGDFGTPGESVTKSKRNKIVQTAFSFIDTLKKAPESWRIDFIGVEMDSTLRIKKIELIENAIN